MYLCPVLYCHYCYPIQIYSIVIIPFFLSAQALKKTELVLFVDQLHKFVHIVM